MSLPDILRGERVAEAMARPRNAFTGLRLALALAVVVSHAFSVTSGHALDEPLTRLTGFTLGEHAVNGFFAVSGFLVTMSLDRRGMRDYLVARSLRILPGLVVATLAVTVLLGTALTSLPSDAYLTDPKTWSFVKGTLTTFKSNAALPGLFSDNPYRSPLGTVWTLKYEVLCYLGVLGAGALGLLARPFSAAILAGGLALALAGLDAVHHGELAKGLETALRLPLIFCVGAALYLGRTHLRLSWPLVLALTLACALLQNTPLYRVTLFATEAYAAVTLGLAAPLARAAFDPPADLSYGIYLYGWPIQQSLAALSPGSDPWMLLPPALALTGLVAAASWYGIERPALGLKARVLGRRVPGTVAPGGP